jgi:hypothetical protein
MSAICSAVGQVVCVHARAKHQFTPSLHCTWTKIIYGLRLRGNSTLVCCLNSIQAYSIKPTLSLRNLEKTSHKKLILRSETGVCREKSFWDQSGSAGLDRAGFAEGEDGAVSFKFSESRASILSSGSWFCFRNALVQRSSLPQFTVSCESRNGFLALETGQPLLPYVVNIFIASCLGLDKTFRVLERQSAPFSHLISDWRELDIERLDIVWWRRRRRQS